MKEAFFIGGQTQVPMLLVSEPGKGKTHGGAYVLAKALGAHLEQIPLNQRDQADIGGYPYPDPSGQAMKFLAGDWCHRINHAHASGQKTALFFDELSTVGANKQGCALKVIHEGWVGDLQLPEETLRWAAMNPPECAAGGHPLTAPMSNRFCHLDFDISHREWCEGMNTGWAAQSIPVLPSNWKDRIGHWRTVVSGYIWANPTALHRFPAESSEQAKPWPSARSWENCAILLAACESVNAKEDIGFTLVSGCVGTGAAPAFHRYMKELDLPDPEMILAKPDKTKLSGRSDKDYTMLQSVVAAVAANNTKERRVAAWHVLETVYPQDGGLTMAATGSLLKVKHDQGYTEIPDSIDNTGLWKEIRNVIGVLEAK